GANIDNWIIWVIIHIKYRCKNLVNPECFCLIGCYLTSQIGKFRILSRCYSHCRDNSCSIFYTHGDSKFRILCDLERYFAVSLKAVCYGSLPANSTVRKNNPTNIKILNARYKLLIFWVGSIFKISICTYDKKLTYFLLQGHSL